MPKIIFSGWRVGMRGIPFMLLLKENAGISLKQAQNIKLKILDNELVVIEVPGIEVARHISFEADRLGVTNEITE